jgi:hypothetical protein
MIVAVLEPEAHVESCPADQGFGPDSVGRASEWIDPEGDDWLAEIYREAHEPAGLALMDQAPEFVHWFG